MLDNPRRSTPSSLNIGLPRRAATTSCAWTRTPTTPRTTWRKGSSACQRGGADQVTGPQIPHGDGTWSRRVAIALDTSLGRGGAQWEANGGEKDIDSGFTGVWRRSTLDEYGGWDDGWPVNQDSELAARFFERGRRIVCVPELGALYMPRDTLKSLARQYWRYGFYRAKTRARIPRACAARTCSRPLS